MPIWIVSSGRVVYTNNRCKLPVSISNNNNHSSAGNSENNTDNTIPLPCGIISGHQLPSIHSITKQWHYHRQHVMMLQYHGWSHKQLKNPPSNIHITVNIEGTGTERWPNHHHQLSMVLLSHMNTTAKPTTTTSSSSFMNIPIIITFTQQEDM